MATLLVLAIIAVVLYRQLSQGLFGSFLAMILSLISAFVSLNYYERLGLLLDRVGAAGFGSRTIALLGLFLVVFLVLQLLADRYIPTPMFFPRMVNRIGSVVCGLMLGLVVAGMVLLGFQLLPVGPTILGFDRYEDPTDLENKSHVFPNPDGFVLGLFNTASRYALAGELPFNRLHPDLQRELYLNRMTVAQGSRHEAAPDSISVEDVYVTDSVHNLGSGDPVFPSDYASGDDETDTSFLVVTMKMNAGGAKSRGAADADGRIRFLMGHVRLVGYDKARKDGGTVRFPTGTLLPGYRMMQERSIDEGLELSRSDQVSLLFPWPGIDSMPPQWLEFKQTAWAEMPAKPLALDEVEMDAAFLLDGVDTARQAPLSRLSEAPGRGYECKTLTLFGSGQGVPILFDSRMLTDFEINRDGDRPEQVMGEFTRGHILFESESKLETTTGIGALSVPEGMALVVLQIEGTGITANQFRPPVLKDTLNGSYYPSGLAISSKNGKQVEFAYSIRQNDGGSLGAGIQRERPYPESLKMSGANPPLETINMFYLVGKESVPILLIGTRAQDGSKTLWTVDHNVDAILVPQYIPLGY